MAELSQKSKERLSTCHPDLQRLFGEVARRWPCEVLCGHRDREGQERSFQEGRSKVHFPLSKHNASPSLAADVAPIPLDWSDTRRFYYFAGFVRRVAEELGIPFRWGGDWDGDLEIKDQNFNDLVHFELVGTDSKQ